MSLRDAPDSTDRVIDAPERSRFVVTRDDVEIGKALYRREGNIITFTHTVIDPAIQERGLGSLLAKAALDAVAAEDGTRVVAECPFIAAYIDRHPEYRPLLLR